MMRAGGSSRCRSFEDEVLKQLRLAMAGAADDMHVFVALRVGERERDGGIKQRLERRVVEIGGDDLARRALVLVRRDEFVAGRGVFERPRPRGNCGRAVCGDRRITRSAPRPRGKRERSTTRRSCRRPAACRSAGKWRTDSTSSHLANSSGCCLGDRGQRGDEVEISLAERRIEYFERSRRVRVLRWWAMSWSR